MAQNGVGYSRFTTTDPVRAKEVCVERILRLGGAKGTKTAATRRFLSDVSEFLTHRSEQDFYGEWGVETAPRGSGLVEPSQAPPPRTVYLLQRKATPLGAGLGKTTGWIHRKALRQRGVALRCSR